MRKFCKIISVILVVLFVIMIPVNVVLRMFDNTLAVMIAGSKFWELENEDPNAIYYKGDYASEADRLAAGMDLCYQVEAEGAALLLNNGALPLANGAKVSTLSVNSANLTYGGTGSGNVDASAAVKLDKALTNSGLVVNETLWNWYNSEEVNKLIDEALASQTTEGESYALVGQAPIFELSMSVYPENVKNSISEYGDAVIVTFSRVGGEGYDCAFPGYEGNPHYENYLELNDEEKELLKFANDLKSEGKIKSIVVLINTSNPLELDFLMDYSIDACLWVGGLGIAGTEAVADILAGKVNPSGSLVDTYCYDNFTSPAMQNYVAQTYGGYNGQIPESASTYMVYQEGIYVGYKYYETRYEDYVMGNGNAGSFIYGDQVAFPFGYGLSYTTFTYSDMAVNYNGETDQYEITVTVTNDGLYDGKETVQIYLQSPYTSYDKAAKIEKASVQLVGFGKTNVIKAGDSETITINVDRRELACYDAYVAATYIVENGDYYFTAATDSHNAINNILAKKGYSTANTVGRMDGFGDSSLVCTVTVENDKNIEYTYAESLNGTWITNQLSDSDPNMYFGEGTVTFLSRSDWEGTWPTESVKLTLNDRMVKELQIGRWTTMGTEYFNVPDSWNKMPTLNAKNGLSLYDMFKMDEDKDGVAAATDFNDPAWNKLLENVTIDELVSLGDCFHWRHAVPSVNAPGSRDENGPQGLSVALFGSGLGAKTTAFTSEDVMAATFNLDLMYQVGVMIGNDCVDAGVSCLYGPGANTHRTPYGGRNFEYYSEDGFLAGEMGGIEIKGILSKGVDVVMKHFALNDTEQDRLGQAAWLTEQAAREIYLKGFQKALEENEGLGGVMTAYTRWGTSWSAMNQGLMQGILRGEWGNVAMCITDNVLNENYNCVDAILGGGVTCFDAMMPFAYNHLNDAKNDPVVVNAMVNAMHHNLYTIINSAAMNGVGPETTVKAVTPAICNTIAIVTVVLGVAGIGGCILFRKKD
jgi:beta-glucosidase